MELSSLVDYDIHSSDRREGLTHTGAIDTINILKFETPQQDSVFLPGLDTWNNAHEY
jgi:hypothetical protein